MPLYRLPVFLGPPRHNLHRPQRAPSRWGHFFVRRTNEGSPARRADVSESVIGAEWCHCGLVVKAKCSSRSKSRTLCGPWLRNSQPDQDVRKLEDH